MKYLIFLIPLLWNLISYSQKRLEIGEKCPDININGVINYPDSNISLIQFKGKAIIIDFWNTGCSTCIEDFHKIDSLQRIFDSSIQFLLVNHESKDSTKRFFEKRSKIPLPDVPMITGDHILSRLFPHYGFPYQVWIDKRSIVRYIMPAYNATFKHIQKFLSGENLAVQNYKPNDDSGLSKGITEWQSKMDYYSFISHCDPANNLENLEGAEIDGKSITISCNCLSVVELFKKAFREYNKYNFNTRGSVVLKAKDSFRYIRPKDPNLLDQWRDSFSFDYALLLPKSRSKDIYHIMQNNLSMYFNIDASIQKREVKCMVLVRTSNIDKLATNKGIPVNKLTIMNNYDIDDTVRYMHNIPFTKFRSELSAWIESYTSMPFYDETGYEGNIDIKLRNKDIDPFSLQNLQADLNKYDLNIVKKNKLIDVLVLVKK